MLVGALRKLLFSLRGNNKFSRFEELKNLQYLSQEKIRELQFTELSKVISHAYTTTEYYKEVFTSLGIKPSDIRSFEDYAKLPILTKALMQDNLERLCSSATPRENRIHNTSGGTTGNPARFYQDKHVFDEMDAHFLLILSLAGWTPDDMIISLWGNPQDTLSQKKPNYLKSLLSGSALLNAYRYDAKTMNMWVETIKRHKRVLIYGYSTVITDFARYCIENNIKGLPVFAIVTTAEVLTPIQRDCMEKAFSCKVFDQYGAREMPGVSSQCEHGNMHLLTTATYAEFLPLDESIDENNSHKRIILTSLNNYTMPLLRYEIGDFGSPSDGICACKRGYPLMQMGVGRIGSALVLPDGGKLYSTMFVRQMYNIDGINFFQFCQKSLHHVNLYIVKGKNFTAVSESKLQELSAKFPISICPGAKLEIHYVDDIPRTQGGKHRQVVCEVEL